VGSQDTAFGLEGGADGYLTQPVEPPVLIAHIKALLRMRRAEESAREQAVQWQTTFDALGDGIFLLDKDRRVMQCNRAMAELLKQSADAIQGRLLADTAPAALNDAILPVNADQDGMTVHANEIRIGDRWFRVTSDPIPGDGVSGKRRLAAHLHARHPQQRDGGETLPV
jgi:PAS domain-containing protein